MPHASLKLLPGVDQNETAALNEGGVSNSNLIRYVYDKRGIGLIQKIGGWTKYYAGQFTSSIRALWGWEDTNSNSWLAVGSTTLNVIQNATDANDITPTYYQDDISPISVSTTAGSSLVTITDSTFATSSYDSVFIRTQISVGGLVLYGYYSINTLSSTAYTLNATNVIGFEVFATYTTVGSPITITGISGATGSAVTYTFSSVGYTFPTGSWVYITGISPSQFNGLYKVTGATTTSVTVASTATGSWVSGGTVSNRGIVPKFDTTNGSSIVTVTLPNHGYQVGSNFVVGVSTTVGGITLYGNYTVVSLSSSDPTSIFTITATTEATSTTSAFMNNAAARYYYAVGSGPPAAGSGYGAGGYGSGGYGTGVTFTPASGIPITASDWTLDNWGQILVACPVGGGIYQWDPSTNAPTATAIPYAPFVNDGIFVAMPERQVIAWGSSFNDVQDPLLVRWCDIGNLYVWRGVATNQAGSYRIPRGSRIVGGIQGPQQGLIWTDVSIWSMQYVNQPLIYSFNEIGTGCGLIARKAATSMNGIVYWMGQSQFFTLSGDGVQPLPCPVWDFIFQNLDTANVSKIRVAPNSRFNEISWFFPTKGASDVTSYVKYNTFLRQWDVGTLARTAWINESVLGPPIGSSTDGYIYQHETSSDADGQPILSSFQTGYFAIADGDNMSFVDQVWPDMKWGYNNGYANGAPAYTAPLATVNITFYVTDYPGDTPQKYGPYTLNQSTEFVSPRFRGRLVSIAIDSSDIGTWWRIGNIRYRYQPDGKY